GAKRLPLLPNGRLIRPAFATRDRRQSAAGSSPAARPGFAQRFCGSEFDEKRLGPRSDPTDGRVPVVAGPCGRPATSINLVLIFLSEHHSRFGFTVWTLCFRRFAPRGRLICVRNSHLRSNTSKTGAFRRRSAI